MTKVDRIALLRRKYLAGELKVNSKRLAYKMIEYEKAFHGESYKKLLGQFKRPGDVNC